MSHADLRSLPPVDALAAEVDAPRAIALAAARTVLAARRAELLSGSGGDPNLTARARAAAAASERPSLRRVLNATGVIVHTNLGRAPLAAAAREAVAAAAEGYPFPTNLDRDTPVGSLNPESQAQLVWRALSNDWDQETFVAELAAQTERRRSSLAR